MGLVFSHRAARASVGGRRVYIYTFWGVFFDWRALFVGLALPGSISQEGVAGQTLVFVANLASFRFPESRRRLAACTWKAIGHSQLRRNWISNLSGRQMTPAKTGAPDGP